MEQQFNKPIVFLSHSKRDSEFIKRLVVDLPKYKIDVWFDEDEIRPGKPWLDSIFVHGIPRCDAILVYFTESSMSSPVVKKEMDAGILQTLSDNNIVFLPFVNDAKIRPLLRSDIRSLQTLEWNDSNYSSLLPSVVAEIWRSYLERTVASATKDERLKRVEAELELEKIRNQHEDFFSPSENAEFEFIWNSYDKTIPITIIETTQNVSHKDETFANSHQLVMNLATLVASLTDQFGVEYDSDIVNYMVKNLAIKLLGISLKDENGNLKVKIEMEGFPELGRQLLMYGLIEGLTYPNNLGRVENHMIFPKKFFRFRYWLAHHQKLPDSIVMEVVKDT
jgi:hypothetical protein